MLRTVEETFIHAEFHFGSVNVKHLATIKTRHNIPYCVKKIEANFAYCIFFMQ